MNCIILNELNNSSKIINKLISNNKSLKLCGDFINASDAFLYLSNNKVDILFSSSVYAELIEQSGYSPVIILFTTKRTSSVKINSNKVADYISLPCSVERLKSALIKAGDLLKNTKTGSSEEFIFVRSNTKIEKIFKKDISYVLSRGQFHIIITPKKHYPVHDTLIELEEKLFPFKLFGLNNTYFPSNKSRNDSSVSVEKYYLKMTDDFIENEIHSLIENNP